MKTSKLKLIILIIIVSIMVGLAANKANANNTTIDKIYTLKLSETIVIPGEKGYPITITRVPGGWVYHTVLGGMAFVPWISPIIHERHNKITHGD